MTRVHMRIASSPHKYSCAIEERAIGEEISSTANPAQVTCIDCVSPGTIDMSKETTVSVLFYVGNVSDYNQKPFVVSFAVPDGYDYARIVWPRMSDAGISAEDLVDGGKYLGMSREAING